MISFPALDYCSDAPNGPRGSDYHRTSGLDFWSSGMSLVSVQEPRVWFPVRQKNITLVTPTKNFLIVGEIGVRLLRGRGDVMHQMVLEEVTASGPLVCTFGLVVSQQAFLRLWWGKTQVIAPSKPGLLV